MKLLLGFPVYSTGTLAFTVGSWNHEQRRKCKYLSFICNPVLVLVNLRNEDMFMAMIYKNATGSPMKCLIDASQVNVVSRLSRSGFWSFDYDNARQAARDSCPSHRSSPSATVVRR